MKGHFLGILAIFFASISNERLSLQAALNVGTILPKCGSAACEHHDDARTCARTAPLAVTKFFARLITNLVATKIKKMVFDQYFGS